MPNFCDEYMGEEVKLYDTFEGRCEKRMMIGGEAQNCVQCWPSPDPDSSQTRVCVE